MNLQFDKDKSTSINNITQKNSSKRVSIRPDPSPRTIKKNKSREDFIKFHWPWTL